jgi:CRP-like cAMP-binding protein
MNKKILLIEDNNDIRETTAVILELAQYTTITARNGKEGVELAISECPDLIICDIMMPVLDGYGVLHLLSKNEKTAGIPFIFLTAKAERWEIRKGMDMGADDYISKPFDDIELLNAIESRLKRSEMVKKEFANSANGLNEFLDDVRELSDLQRLTVDSLTRLYRKKDPIYAEGSYAKGLYFVNKGTIKTYRTNEQGKELITGMFKEGDFFGYHALLEDEPHRDSAMAMEDAEICTIPKEEFFSLIYKNAQVSRKFIKMMSSNLQEKEDQLLKLAYNSVRKRVAEALIKLHTHYNEGSAGRSLSVSREDLANLAGTATETTIRTLSDFRQEGLIDIQASSINILKYDQLAAMKN